MTYCLAIAVDKGLVFASDSRTNAGVDYVTTYSKMHSFVWPGERVCVILSAGSLATSQAVLSTIRSDLASDGAAESLTTGRSLQQVARYIGALSQAEQERHADATKGSTVSLEASFILGGQIKGQPPEIFLIYPQGNCITASPETPYLQIGETKYGKPILDRVISPSTSLEDAARCALVSLDSTMRSNISVGPPMEFAIHCADQLKQPHHQKLVLNSPLYRSLQKKWSDGLQRAFQRLPRFDWE